MTTSRDRLYTLVTFSRRNKQIHKHKQTQTQELQRAQSCGTLTSDGANAAYSQAFGLASGTQGQPFHPMKHLPPPPAPPHVRQLHRRSPSAKPCVLASHPLPWLSMLHRGKAQGSHFLSRCFPSKVWWPQSLTVWVLSQQFQFIVTSLGTPLPA